MRKLKLFALLTIAAAGSAHAQASIDPGMTKEQVIARLGKPASEHSSGTATYLYYANGQEKKVGMSDMVALDNGKVVDAVFRSSARRYSGKSSSPAAISTEAAIAKGNGGKAPPLKMPPAKKAVPPTTRKPEPLTKTDAKKIQAPPKPADTAKKAAPAPAKKP
jgi:outer membrane protein assembly factor BamE (lipoprotein component of BamABCDE complex)